jgi:hypothetical protein
MRREAFLVSQPVLRCNPTAGMARAALSGIVTPPGEP